jgi:L-asparaginase/Glu-tRNA(Gln) amidotransferase subunit D
MTKLQFLSMFPTLLLGAGGHAHDVAPPGANGPPLPTVVVLATGGTIAGAAETDVQAGYSSGQVGVDQLLNAVPQAKKLANLRGEQI